jgi:hypothetical protein
VKLGQLGLVAPSRGGRDLPRGAPELRDVAPRELGTQRGVQDA